jgi:predicted transcriptional regulator
MANRKTSTFTEVELEFMQLLWDRGEMSPDEMLQALHGRGRRLADGSIRKILSILLDKGHVTRKRDGRTFRYRARVVREQAQKHIVKDMLKRAFAGSAPEMVASLLDTRDLQAGDLEEIKKLIAEKEAEQER